MRPTTTVTLTEMAEVLTSELDLEAPIDELTPYDWWRRHNHNTLSMPMPAPIRMVGRSPVFLIRDIKRWYVSYKGLVLEADGRVKGAKRRAKEKAEKTTRKAG